jgi:Fe-S-cluster-containing dehydrogenase component
MDTLRYLYVRRLHPPCLDACTVTGLWAELGGVVGCRYLYTNDLTGLLPTELGTMDALIFLCVHCLHPPRLDACAVTGLWAEHGGGGLCAGGYPPTILRGRCPPS